MAKKKVTFNALKKLTVQQRVEAVKSPEGATYLSSLSPTDFALLFPKYYQKGLPDVGGFREAISKATQEQQQKYYESIDQKLGTTSPGARERMGREGTTGGGGAGGSTGGGKISNPVMVRQIYDYLTKEKGVDHNHAIGIINNMKHESNFNSAIQPPQSVMDREGGPSGGLFQHHDNYKRGEHRFSDMVKYASQGGKDWRTNWKGQIDFALTEGDMKKYLSTSYGDEKAASIGFTRDFERPKNTETVAFERAAEATKYSNFIKSGGGVTTPGTTDTGTPGTTSNMVGKSFANAKGNTECAAYAQMAGGVGHTSGWKPGQHSSSGGLKPGDWVAAFHGDKYMNKRNRDDPGNGSHVARFESYIYDEKGKIVGMNVTHQYNGSGGVIPGKFMFGSGGEFDANRYHQIVDRGNPASMTASDGTDIKIQERKQYLLEHPEADAGDQVSPGEAQVQSRQQVEPPQPLPHLPAAAGPEVRQQDLTAKVEKPVEKKQAPSKSEPVRYKFNQAEFIKEVRAKETGAMFVSDEYIMGETVKGFQTTPGVKFDKKSGIITIDDPNSPAIQTITNDMKSHGFDQDKFLTRQGGPSAEGPSATVDKSPAPMPTDEEPPVPAHAGGGKERIKGSLSFAPIPPQRGDNLLVTDSAGKKFTMNTKENISVNPNSQTATITHRKDLGAVAAIYESRGKGVETVSSGMMRKGKKQVADPGGVSYGAHQLTSRTPGAKKQTGGTMGEFLRSKEGEPFRERLGSETPGSAGFSKIYKDIAANEKQKFTEAQHNFITRTLYEPTQKKAAKLGYNVEDPKVQEALYSISVQHGRGGASRILRKASHMADSSPEKQVESIFNVRSRSFPEFAKKRYTEERKNILAFKPSDEMTTPDKTQVAAAGQKEQKITPTDSESVMPEQRTVAAAEPKAAPKSVAMKQPPTMLQKFKRDVFGINTAAAAPMQESADVTPTQEPQAQIEPFQRAFPAPTAPDPFIGQIENMKTQMNEISSRMEDFGPSKQEPKQSISPSDEPRSPDYLNNLLQTGEKPYFNPSFRRAMSRATSGLETVDETGGNHYSFGTKGM